MGAELCGLIALDQTGILNTLRSLEDTSKPRLEPTFSSRHIVLPLSLVWA